MEVLVGDFVILTCKVISGTGKLNVHWVVDGQPVAFGQLSPTVLVRSVCACLNFEIDTISG
jgi:hypothetical protein